MAGSATLQSVKSPIRSLAVAATAAQRAIARIAESDCPVLLLGEPGSGKRFTATQIHALSHAPRGFFKEIDCRQTDKQELLAALSVHGTIYLSEITELGLSLQDLLLDSCGDQETLRGGRILFGSSREATEELLAGRISEQFYQLISTITLRIAPLRSRKAEIPGLADELLTQYSKQFDRPRPVLRKEITDFLLDHAWPGNLPEFQTAIKTLVAIGDQSISLTALKAAAPAVNLCGCSEPQSLKEATRAAAIRIERQMISAALAATGGNRKRAADELKISYKALLYKLKQIGTESPSRMNGVA